MARQIERALQPGQEGAKRALTQYRDLLMRCRSDGIDAAFAEQTSLAIKARPQTLALIRALIECDSPAAVIDLAEQHPELLSDEIDALLQQGIANACAQSLAQAIVLALHIDAHREILRRSRRWMDAKKMTPERLLSDAVFAFLNAWPWDEKKRLVTEQPDLLYHSCR